MKRIFTLSVIAVAGLLISSCSRSGYNGYDDSYWYSKEKGEVVYSDPYCDYFVVETYYGYNIVRAYSGYRPYENALVYGNFSSRGTRDFYNASADRVFSGTVTDYWLTYNEAQDALDYYCPLKTGKGRDFKTATQVNTKVDTK